MGGVIRGFIPINAHHGWGWIPDSQHPRSVLVMALWSWGSDVYGRLGHGTEDQHLGTPTEVRVLSDSRLISVTIGSAHNVAIEEDGKCYTWGKCHYGQLGHGEMDQNELIPRPVSALASVKITSVGVGDSHVLAVTDAGELYTWGVGFYGCLGHGDETSLTTPKRVEKLHDGAEVVVSATGGAFHSLCVNDCGQVYVWGRNHCGQLGMKALEMPDYSKGGKVTKLVRLNQKLPVQLTMKPEYVAKMVSARNDHSLILLENGCMLSFGSNDKGQLGRDQKTPEMEDVNDFLIDPNHFKNSDGSPEKVAYISAGYDHCAAITESNLLYTWGGGKYGQHGQGHTRDVRIPSLVDRASNGKQIKLSRVSCGDSFSVALSTDGTLLAFGSSDYGKLGTGNDGIVTKPTPISTKMPTTINGICCGTNHTLAYTLIQK